MSSKDYFTGKIAVVTGGGSGIGLGLCQCLEAAGATVYAADINEQKLQQVASSSAIRPLVVDVSREEDFARALDQVIGEHGQLDILVNNAGIALAGAFSETPLADIERIVAINFWSVIHGTRLAYSRMIAQGQGHIVNVSSSGGAMPVPNQTMYSAIKHSVLGFSHSLREEAAHHGVKVSAVLPGMVQSDLWETAVNIEDYDMKKTMQETGLKPITSRQAGEAILRGIEANQRSIIFPRINRVILALYRFFPNLMARLVVAPLATPPANDGGASQ